MKKTRNFLCGVLIILMALCGCNSQSSCAEIVFQCFLNSDFDTLNGLFCENSRDMHSLESEFKEGINFFDSKIITSNPNIKVINEGQAVDKGVMTKKDKIFLIDDITTEKGTKYRISFHVYEVNADDESKVGITNIVIAEIESGKKVRIGEKE